MVKCKKCDHPDLEWDRSYNEQTGKWRLWNPSTERPHECTGKKKKEKPKDSKLWKTAWKPEMDLPSQRICGICKTVCVKVEDCPSCEKFKLNPCNCWCPKCEKHPAIISVEKIT